MNVMCVRSFALEDKLKGLYFCPKSNRYDLTKEKIITIDSKYTKVYDDALSIEEVSDNHYIVGIHITDINSLGYNLENACYKKVCGSLIEGVKRDALTLYLEVKDNSVIAMKFLKSIIKVNCNLKFENNDSVINNYKKSIDLLKKTINFEGDNYSLLVKQYMILYNGIIGRIFYDLDLPCLYINDGINRPFLSNKCYGYQGLIAYSYITSPLTSKLSRIMQVLVETFCFNDYTDDDKKYWMEKVKKLSKKYLKNEL